MEIDPKLIFPSSLWERVLSELYLRTEGEHESGAFLLGKKIDGRREVVDVVFYDELDSEAYKSGVVILHAASFGPLWDLCRSHNLTVVADIHVHPRRAWQSESDRQNPMIARAGHLALILPWFARPPISLTELGFFEYQGNHQWKSLGGHDVSQFLIINF